MLCFPILDSSLRRSRPLLTTDSKQNAEFLARQTRQDRTTAVVHCFDCAGWPTVSISRGELLPLFQITAQLKLFAKRAFLRSRGIFTYYHGNNNNRDSQSEGGRLQLCAPKRTTKTLTQYLIRTQIKLRFSFNYYRFNQTFDSIAPRRPVVHSSSLCRHSVRKNGYLPSCTD